jgi:hypothetical protein
MAREAVLLFVFVAFCQGAALGADVRTAEITHDNGRYAVRFDVHIAARSEPLKSYLTDYARYAERFPAIRESTILQRRSPTDLRLRLQIHGCVLFFCRTVTTVKDVKELPNNVITAAFDPTLSSFREGSERWQITPDADGTRLQYEARLVPAFYVPPLIGPWIMKRQLRSLLIDNARKLEVLAR